MNDRAYPPITLTAKIVRFTLLVMLMVLAVAMLFVLRYNPPTEDSFYPGCMLYRTTGLNCTGCGMTRSVYAAMWGEFEQSFAWHPLAVVLLPFVAFSMFRSLLSWSMGTTVLTSTSLLSRWSLKILVIVLVTFTVVRNFPWYPFTLLAPHELRK